MIKATFVLINLIGVLFLNIWFADGIEITHNFPEQMDPGEEMIIHIDINKGNVTGFAKLQLELESGLDVEAFDMNGASFTYKNGIAKCIWLALPIQENVRIKLRLKASEDAQNGLRTILGKFSYLQDNRRMTQELEPHELIVGHAVVDTEVQTLEIKEVTDSEISTELPVNIQREISYLSPQEILVALSLSKKDVEGYAKLEDIVPTGFEVIEQDKGGATFQVVKNKVKFSWFNLSNDFTVNISYILKSEDLSMSGVYDITGEFSYVKDKEAQFLPIPVAEFRFGDLVKEEFFENEALIESTSEPIKIMEPSAVNSKDQIANTSLSKEVAKIDIDVEGEPPTEPLANILPPKPPVEPITEVKDVDMVVENIEAPIAFSDEQKPNRVPAAPKEITKNRITDVVKESEKNNANEVVSESISAPVKPVITKQPISLVPPKAKKDASTNSLASIRNVSNMPEPEEGITYRVQIAAGKNVVDAAHFKKIFKFTAPFILENHEGWVKYTTGKFDNYKKARDKREDIRSNFQFNGPFVTAYNYGERITVQEALMITNQNWYQ